MTIFRTLCVLAVAFGMFTSTSDAQDWPTRPVRVIVPYAPGGSTDVVARHVSQYLTRSLGQQVFVENRTGANGVLGMDVAAKSDPDGYTILVTTSDFSLNPHVYKTGYSPQDFAPVIQLSRQPVVIAAHPSLGVKSLADLVALGKRQPGIRFGTGSGIGSGQAIVMLWFAKMAGIDVQQVPYRGGGQVITDLLAGTVQLASLGSTPAMSHYKAGNLFLLAQSTKARVQSLPNVPTFQEQGFDGLVSDQWIGLLVPAKTPKPIIERLNVEVGKALTDPELKANLFNSGQEAVGGTTEAFSALIRDDNTKYERLVKELNIKAQ